MIKSVLLVGLGGGIGSIFRYLISVYVSKQNHSMFPFGTFLVNCIGCLIIGILFGYFEKQISINNNLKLMFITGFCGGFTTFSTFALEYYRLFELGNYMTALLYILLSILLGLLALGFGIYLMK